VSTIEQPVRAIPQSRTERKGNILAYWLATTDHKTIGHLYLITSFFFFLCAGVMALLMRIQLLGPDQHFVSDQQFNEQFTMHGTLMLLLFATPMFVGFANELIPLQIGAPDVAFPRLNLLSYYMFVFGGIILMLSFLSMSTGPQTDLKILATGLGAGILIDAVVIRCLLVPAMVALFGRANWWMPERLARLLRVPSGVVRPDAATEVGLAPEPTPALAASR